MSVETFMQQLRAPNSSFETLAVIGAELRLRRDGLRGDGRVAFTLARRDAQNRSDRLKRN
jgi:hypothetical protein